MYDNKFSNQSTSVLFFYQTNEINLKISIFVKERNLEFVVNLVNSWMSVHLRREFWHLQISQKGNKKILNEKMKISFQCTKDYPVAEPTKASTQLSEGRWFEPTHGF